MLPRSVDHIDPSNATAAPLEVPPALPTPLMPIAPPAPTAPDTPDWPDEPQRVQEPPLPAPFPVEAPPPAVVAI